MHVNTVRVYAPLDEDAAVSMQILDECYRRGIMVILTVAASKDDLDSGRYLETVTRYQNHPAILMWALGNEWNFNTYYGSTMAEARLKTNEAAQQIKARDTHHPVSSVLGDRFLEPPTRCSPGDAWHAGVTQQQGRVGIGTMSPQATLHVEGSGIVTGDLDVRGNLAAKYQDVAEWVVASRPMSAGMVATLDQERANRVIPASTAYDTRVAGVISPQPGLKLGTPGTDKVLVATTGRVKVKATAKNGAIAIGDLLVTSEQEGRAMRSTPVDLNGTPIHRPGTVLGKALEPLAEGDGEILVLLTLQ